LPIADFQLPIRREPDPHRQLAIGNSPPPASLAILPSARDDAAHIGRAAWTRRFPAGRVNCARLHAMDGLLPQSATNSPGQWAVIALGVVTVLYVAVVRPMRKGKRKDPLDRPPGQLSLAQQRAVEREMSNLLLEYEEMLRRMTAQLETRAAKLELLISQADERLARLEAARQLHSKLGNRPPPAEAAAGGAVPEPTASDRPSETSAPASADTEASPHDPVYQLADQGQTPRQIAQQLNRPHGEIELILALRPAHS
jgi:hypothetical protein